VHSEIRKIRVIRGQNSNESPLQLRRSGLTDLNGFHGTDLGFGFHFRFPFLRIITHGHGANEAIAECGTNGRVLLLRATIEIPDGIPHRTHEVESFVHIVVMSHFEWLD
jgi:hypothetical protein